MMTTLAVVAAGICAGGVIYQWLGVAIAVRWQAEAGATSKEALPPVTLLRPLKSDVPDLHGKLDLLARALRPGDQLVLGAAEDSEELEQCAVLQRWYPDCDIVVVPCREGVAANPKISKLLQMDGECRHGRLIVSDSEAVIDAVWLEELRREWLEHDCAVLTTPYRFIGAKTWPQRLDAAAALLALWPGLAVVRQWGRANFTMGACTALRRRDLTEVGGWAAFGDFLAEDRELGAALAAGGHTIRLAVTVTTLDCDPLGWRDWWRHQCRVATTYRMATPAGFAGMFLTHSASAAAVLAALPLEARWRIWCVSGALLSVVLRWLGARKLGQILKFSVPGLFVALLIAGWMETIAWMRSWLVGRVWWSQREWRIGRGGRLQKAEMTVGG